MTVLVTGATGFLGLACVEEFLSNGWDVVATGRDAEKWAQVAPQNARFIQADLAKPDDCKKLPSAVSCVVHCAAKSSPWGTSQQFAESNIAGLKNLLKHVRTGRFVHISSTAVNFRYAHRLNEREGADWSTPPPNHYVATKRLAEEMVWNSGWNYVVLRPHAIIGPRDTSIVPRVMRLAKKGIVPLVGDDVKLDLTHVADVASAAYLAATNPNVMGKHFNISGGSPISRQEAFETLFQAAGQKVRFVRVPYSAGMVAAKAMEMFSLGVTMGQWEPPLTRFSVSEVAHSVTFDISKARKELGYTPTRNPIHVLKELGAQWRQKHQ